MLPLSLQSSHQRWQDTVRSFLSVCMSLQSFSFEFRRLQYRISLVPLFIASTGPCSCIRSPYFIPGVGFVWCSSSARRYVGQMVVRAFVYERFESRSRMRAYCELCPCLEKLFPKVIGGIWRSGEVKNSDLQGIASTYGDLLPCQSRPHVSGFGHRRSGYPPWNCSPLSSYGCYGSKRDNKGRYL